jgi:uncharacterized membrane protein
MNTRVSAWLTVVLGVGAVLAISGLVLRATIEVRHHRGAETYVNAQGMQVHWIDVLTLSAAVLIALIALLVATLIYNRRRNGDAALIRKLEARNAAASSADHKNVA